MLQSRMSTLVAATMLNVNKAVAKILEAFRGRG